MSTGRITLKPRITRFINGRAAGGFDAKPDTLDKIEADWRSTLPGTGPNEALNVTREGNELGVETTDGSFLRWCYSPGNEAAK